MQTKIDETVSYLADVVSDRGGIKKVNDQARKHTQLIQHAVRLFLNELAKHNPELAQFLDSHVMIGKQCYWSLDPRSRIKCSKPSYPDAEPMEFDDGDDCDAI